jgi:hypothetical protein
LAGLFAQDDPNSQDTDQHAGDQSKGQGKRRDVEAQGGCAHRIPPNRSQSSNHRLGITQSTQNPQDTARKGHQGSFPQPYPTHTSRPKPERQQSANLGRALFESKLEEQCHQDQRRQD